MGAGPKVVEDDPLVEHLALPADVQAKLGDVIADADERLRGVVRFPGPGDAAGAPEGLCVGNPQRIIEQIKKWESVGVDRINFLLNCVETAPQQEVRIREWPGRFTPRSAAE